LKQFEGDVRSNTKAMIANQEAMITATADLDQVQCLFYRTVVEKGVQYRLGDCVYVNALGGKRKSLRDIRKDRIIRLEKMWRDAQGELMAVGHQFLRPGDTHIKPNQRFFEQEVMVGPYTDTFNMKEVLGLCWVLRVNNYLAGRPREVAEAEAKDSEADVWVTDFRYNVESKGWIKLPQKDTWPTATHKSVFERFVEPLEVTRVPFDPKAKAFIPPPPAATVKEEPKPKESHKKGKGKGAKGGSKRKAADVVDLEADGRKKRAKWGSFTSLLGSLMKKAVPMRAHSSSGRTSRQPQDTSPADFTHLLQKKKGYSGRGRAKSK